MALDHLFTPILQEKRHQVAEGEEGLYSLVFIRCRPPASAVSFRMDARFYNPGACVLSFP